jgi:pimeloyl-ACP methyl ester carboxylesterase
MSIRSALVLSLVVGCWIGRPASGQDPTENIFKQLPPAGMEIDAEVSSELKTASAELRRQLDSAAGSTDDADQWRPDVEVFVRAVELAVDQNLFYKPRDVENARKMLQIARLRLEAIAEGKRGVAILAIGATGEHASRLIAGGFVSEIDGSVQPYAVVLPLNFDNSSMTPLRLDVWLHGRGDTATEVPFLSERLAKLGTYPSDDAITLHPFGRHCNAFKFAGEVDVYEAMKHVARIFAINQYKTSIRGFSMGGAGCWHLAAHDPARWFAANPGAGFVDTVRYQEWDESKLPYDPGNWGRRLMNWYDIPLWVENLRNTNVIAYSGEIDKQRQAAELMIESANAADFDFLHTIGIGMGHKIDEPSAAAMEQQIAQWATEADQSYRNKINLVTYTLRYHEIDWLSIEGMQKHWTRATVTAELVPPATIRMTTENANQLRLDFSRLGWPLASGNTRIEIDGQIFAGPSATAKEPLVVELVAAEDGWYELDSSDAVDTSPRKRPGLQGPIDDAFTAPFLFVLPSRPCRHGAVERFTQAEARRARDVWQRIMRGNDRVVVDTDLTQDQIASYNLVCFGDFYGNRFLASIASGLPIQWQDDQIRVGDQSFDASSHALAMVYPNPKNPNRYVVVNSGLTFREFSNSTNSRQIAMLPDWAVIDISRPADGIYPGRIAAADFFGETWQLETATSLPQE